MVPMHKTICRLVALAALVWTGLPAMAGPVRTDHVEAELVSEVTSIQPGKPFWVALRLDMDEHWHVYWRNAGDAGIPPRLEWELPDTIEAGDIHWPYPSRIPAGPLMNFGYEGEVLLMVPLTPAKELPAGGDVELKLDANWLVCKEVCLPEEASLALTLPVRNEPPSFHETWAPRFEDTRRRWPLQETEWTFGATLPGDGTLALHLAPPEWLETAPENVRFFPHEAGIIQPAADQTWQSSDGAYTLRLERSKTSEDLPSRITGVLVSDTGWRGPESEKALAFSSELGQSPSAGGSAPAGGAATSLWLVLLAAFAGGLILNLMPCVFPIISIKVLGFVNQAHEGHGTSRLHGWLFTAGILVCFWLLAGALLLLRAGGEQIGWGFQLQSPIFLSLLGVIFFLLSLNLFGVFEIGTGLAGTGSEWTSRSDWLGSFSSGLLAVIIATPCTAPFMGAALGYALTQPAYVAMLVFTALGAGMAAPYLILSHSQALIQRIPRPGPWMESLKQFMGFVLLAAVLWMLWVLNQQAGSMAVLLLLAGFLAAAMGCWVYGRWGALSRPRPTRLVARTLGVFVVLASTGLTVQAVNTLAPAATAEPASDTRRAGGLEWIPYDPATVQELRQEGRPVFIDFTAAWCLTCQVNKRVALRNPDIVERFRELNVAPVVADWTNRDPEITRALAEFDRSGVPFYVIYDGAGGEPKTLPELLTPGIVLDALEDLD